MTRRETKYRWECDDEEIEALDLYQGTVRRNSTVFSAPDTAELYLGPARWNQTSWPLELGVL